MTMADTAMPFTVPSDAPATRTAPPPAAPARPARPPLPSQLRPRLGTLPPIPVSATLAANETLARKRRAGEPVLPLAFGEAGLPAHPLLRDALAAASGGNAYGPVAGLPVLREAAAGYWTRRGTPTSAGLGGLRPGQQGAAVRPAAGDRHRRRGAQAELGQLRRAGHHDRRTAALRARPARRGRGLRRRGAGPGRCWPPGRPAAGSARWC